MLRAGFSGALLLLLASGIFSVSPAQVTEGPAFQVLPGGVTPVEVFDTAWTRIRDSYHDTAFVGEHWTQVRERLRPRAERAGSEGELRLVIQAMLDEIGESHFALLPREDAEVLAPAAGDGEEARPAGAGLEVRIVEGAVAVVRVEAGGPGAEAGIRPGWLLESVDDEELVPGLEAVARRQEGVEKVLAAARFEARVMASLRGSAGTERTLALRDGEGVRVVRRVSLREAPGTVVRMGNLPAMVARLDTLRLGDGDRCVGVIRMGIWLAPLAPEFDRAVEGFRSCRGMVVDLRGNPGGLGGMVMGVAGHFLDEVVPLGTMIGRELRMNFVSNPRRVDSAGNRVEVFSGPVAILVDGLSMSTTEIFAAGMQGVGRARVFGVPTPGQALPSILGRLPNGDVLQYAVADFVGPDGSRIEGRGVVPDEVVVLTRERLLQGGDPVLEAALRWLAAADPVGGPGPGP